MIARLVKRRFCESKYENIFYQFDNEKKGGSSTRGPNANSNKKQQTSNRSYENENQFIKKKLKLTTQISKDLAKFGLNESFELSDLKKKYLSYAKLYHPDTEFRKNIKQEGRIFQEIKDSYDRLKVYYELKSNLENLNDKVNKYGRVIVEEIVANFNEYYRSDKAEITEILCKIC